ncbi:putative glucose oxidase [Aspergillus avenaceus]|uniref:glucose oxidase n=1 Tax=Aspergillus avenaceus TaxID=36643 RepID=A0A5N6U0H1_ASPAV|nr:putative glucose oxidase [Aspergillus avenaceus]
MMFPWFSVLLTPTAAIEYDYIIVGGGTSGLAVANRLSENPYVSVLVIEAGQSVLHNPNVTNVDRLAYTYNSPLDWAYETTAQEFGGNTQTMHAGKALGGTSAINGAAYARAERVQIDAWEQLGNDVWTWNELFPYYLKQETISVPDAARARADASVNPIYHGHQGPVSVGFSNKTKHDDVTPILNSTLAAMGIPPNFDLNSGSMRGFTIHPSTIDPLNVRSDAARAYYCPYAERPNLHVQLNTFVSRIVWETADGQGNITAKGVEIETDSENQVIRATREVIIAAGALRSPAILEHSGVGNPKILEKLGIPVELDLPSVGENLQDQLNTSIVVTTNKNMSGTRTVAFATVYDIFGDETESAADKVQSQLSECAQATSKKSNGVMKAEDLLEIFEVQFDHIFRRNVSMAEFVFIFEGSQTLHTGYWGLLPFARGNVHINSPDPRVLPTVNPNFGVLEWDVDVQIAMSKFLRKMQGTGPLEDIVAQETLPGLSTVPLDASDDTWRQWVAEQYTPNFHAIGTTSMLPRSMGGVVDNRLKVYGTTNVRVVDASIQPMQLSGHPMSNIYAISERVSDFIKTDQAHL